MIHFIWTFQIFLVLSLSGLALCGSLSNEYLPASAGVISKSATGLFGGAISNYSPKSRFASTSSENVFGASSIASPQFGVHGTPALKSQFGGQYPTVSQYSKSAAPGQLYGAPSQSLGVSSFRSSTPFSSGLQFTAQPLQSAQYGAPFKSSGPSSFGPSTSLSSGPQYKQSLPSPQYGAPSAFGQQQSIRSFPTQYSSQAAPSHGINSQYGAPQPTAHFGQPSASFRGGRQFGGLSSSHGISSGTPYSGTIQDSNGAYIYWWCRMCWKMLLMVENVRYMIVTNQFKKNVSINWIGKYRLLISTIQKSDFENLKPTTLA